MLPEKPSTAPAGEITEEMSVDRELDPEVRRYRAYVGTAEAYDLNGAMQFNLMVALGLREHHTLLDIGCGSLCAGRLLIPYLKKGNYCGLEPESWLVDAGIRFDVSEEMRSLKKPNFRHVDDFSLTGFNIDFDFMLAHSVLTHVSQAQLARCLSQVKLALKPEGLCAASFYAHGEEIYGGSEWIYPRFASYPFTFVAASAKEHQLAAFPLIWSNSYSHYWMVFAHQNRQQHFSWLGNLAGEQRMLRILELTRQLSDLRVEHDKLKHRLDSAILGGSKSSDDCSR